MTDKQPIDLYVDGCTLLDTEVGKNMVKASTLAKLTTAIICTKVPPDRNKVLYAFTLVKSMRSSLARIEKSLKEVQGLIENVILGMLKAEKLDNYSHDGKLFYPSNKTYYNVSDRTKVEEYIMSLGPEGLQLLGNTLNSDFIKAFIEKNSTVDEETGEIVEALPPQGVGTFTKTTLNMRKKA